MMALLDGAEAVLFDIDDTLLDYTAARDAGFVSWLAERDPARSTKDLDAWQSLEDTHFRRYSAGEISFGEQRRARLRAFWPQLSGAPEAELDEMYETYVVHMEAAWSAVPHAAEVVQVLAARMPVGVLTNGYHAMQVRKLKLLGLEGVPLFASSELVAPKPDPRAYDAACTGLGVPKERTVMVGDDITNDVQGALLAGLSAVWFDRGRGGAVAAPKVTCLRQLLA